MDAYNSYVEEKENDLDKIKMPLSDGTYPITLNLDTIKRENVITRDDDLIAFLNGLSRSYQEVDLESVLYMHNKLINYITKEQIFFSNNYTNHISYINKINILLERFISYGAFETLKNIYDFYLTIKFDDLLNEREKCEKLKIYIQNLPEFEFSTTNINKLSLK